VGVAGEFGFSWGSVTTPSWTALNLELGIDERSEAASCLTWWQMAMKER
jgi:hypothetical protein